MSTSCLNFIKTCTSRIILQVLSFYRNPKCTTKIGSVPACNPKCQKSEGKCVGDGRCECCFGWTGPHAEFRNDGRIIADHCDVYCPYTQTRK